MKKTLADKPFCAHYISKYLPLTENWIYRTVVNHQRFNFVFLSRKKDNLTLFPISNLYSLDDFNKLRQYLEIGFFKASGYFNFFKAVCEKHNVEIIHIHFGYHGAKSIGLKRKLNVPMVCSFYGDDAFADIHRGKYNKLFREADKILVLGAYMKEALIKLGCSANKISIHHLGIDVEKIKFIQRIVPAEKQIKFLIASSFLPKKGIGLAIRALASFKNKYDFTLDLVGDGPLKKDILLEIESGGITERVTLHGYKPYDYFINLTYQCDVFIQASRTTEQNNKEGTPMAIVDAMATGMAVISTKHSDIPEIVIDGETGYLAEENDLNSLIGCFKKVFENKNVIEGFSLKSRQWIEKEFDAKRQTAILEQHYLTLINSAKKS